MKPPEVKKETLQKLVQGSNLFALDVYKDISAKKEKENVFFSPFSISTALAMTYSGAKENTASQMSTALHFTLEPKQLNMAFASLMALLNTKGKNATYQLNIGNALWGEKNYSFLKEFIKEVEETYGAGFQKLDFINNPDGSRQTINQWTAEKTAQKIKNLMGPNSIQPTTRLVLTNAIYFKGNWSLQFPKDKTFDEDFFVDVSTKVKVPMMRQTAEFGYWKANYNLEPLGEEWEVEEADPKKEKPKFFQVLELPYVNKDISMLVFLPNDARGLADLEKILTVANIDTCISAKRQQKVIVIFPKFTISCGFSVANTLQSLGMVDAFSRVADFSGITGDKSIYIGDVVHKAFVDVNEEGTEAAAATGVEMSVKSIEPPDPIFRADHPFFFIIHDNRTGTILFMGKVVNPESKS